MANREALAMVQGIRKDVSEILDWQKTVLERLNVLTPSPAAEGSTVLDFLPESLDSMDAEAFRVFVEASVSKLTALLE